MFCKKVVLKNFAKFTGKHLCWSLFFNKVAGGAKKRDSGTGVCLPVIYVEFLRTPFFYRTPPVAASELTLTFGIVLQQTNV